MPPTSRLRSLTLNVRLQLHHTPSRLGFTPLLSALESFKGVPLESLSLDDYVVIEPGNLHSLAEMFPSLRKLTLGDRTVWSQDFVSNKVKIDPELMCTCDAHSLSVTQSVHLEALAEFPLLNTLECPRWPDSYDEWMEPDELVQEMGEALPRLELLGLSGQQSEGNWWRLGRDRNDPRSPIQVDEVTLYSLDLDRPCY